MKGRIRVVLDTNVLVSATMTPLGRSRDCLDVAFETGVLLLSTPTRSELLDVLYRPGLQRFTSARERAEILARLDVRTEMVAITKRFKACRDPRNDKFLELAVGGKADYLVTGDADLLVLHPFEDIPNLTPAQFLDKVGPAVS